MYALYTHCTAAINNSRMTNVQGDIGGNGGGGVYRFRRNLPGRKKTSNDYLMTTLYTTLSLYMTFTMIYYIRQE